MDTSNILFVASGAFNGLDKLVANRHAPTVGWSRSNKNMQLWLTCFFVFAEYSLILSHIFVFCYLPAVHRLWCTRQGQGRCSPTGAAVH